MSQQLTVTGMNCGGCESTVESAVNDLEGVESVTADNETDSVVIEGDVETAAVVEAIEDAGFDATA